jgi:uncharacterized protein YajQ (UPF0234 family)
MGVTMPSFDVVSEYDEHEIQNAVDQAERELVQRYDFKGTDAKLERTKEGFTLSANSEDRVKAIYDVLLEKFTKRKISTKFLHKKNAEPAGGQKWRMVVDLKKGVDMENAKKIVALIKGEKALKVTPAIQGDTVRVTGKKRDDLQAVIAFLKTANLPLELNYTNFRE